MLKAWLASVLGHRVTVTYPFSGQSLGPTWHRAGHTGD